MDCVVQVENTDEETEIHNLTNVKHYNVNVTEINILHIIKYIFLVIILTFICPVIIGLVIFTLIYLSDHFSKTYTYHEYTSKNIFEIWFIGFVVTLIILLIKSKRSK